MLGLACIVATSPAQGNLNHLRGQTSPYLKRAVSQPVDWYPWGPEAFTRARELDRPILLDVGAVWCPWCTLMITIPTRTWRQPITSISTLFP